jgi:hypothetical protein
MRWWIQAFDGTVNELMFIGLKNYPGSYEWHHGGVDEADEVDERTIQGLRTRLRAPSPEGTLPNYGIDLAFNPPDELHWLFGACTGRTSDGRLTDRWLELFEPVKGENDVNLPPNYFIDNFRGMPEDMLTRLRDGNWGVSFEGDPVYPQYSSSIHRGETEVNPYRPILRFWDFGYRRPACIWAQLDEDYRLIVLDEELGKDEEALHFIQRVKAHSNIRFPQAPGYLDFGDPAAAQKKDTGSTLSILDSQGINLIYIQSSIEEGIRRTRFLLEQLINGKPAFMVDRRRCPMLHRTLAGGYRLHKNSRPLKDGFYDHLADALRYGIINLFNEAGRPLDLPEASNYLPTGYSQIPDSLEYGS